MDNLEEEHMGLRKIQISNTLAHYKLCEDQYLDTIINVYNSLCYDEFTYKQLKISICSSAILANCILREYKKNKLPNDDRFMTICKIFLVGYDIDTFATIINNATSPIPVTECNNLICDWLLQKHPETNKLMYVYESPESPNEYYIQFGDLVGLMYKLVAHANKRTEYIPNRVTERGRSLIVINLMTISLSLYQILNLVSRMSSALGNHRKAVIRHYECIIMINALMTEQQEFAQSYILDGLRDVLEDLNDGIYCMSIRESIITALLAGISSLKCIEAVLALK
jgi:hypothetical protein